MYVDWDMAALTAIFGAVWAMPATIMTFIIPVRRPILFVLWQCLLIGIGPTAMQTAVYNLSEGSTADYASVNAAKTDCRLTAMTEAAFSDGWVSPGEAAAIRRKVRELSFDEAKARSLGRPLTRCRPIASKAEESLRSIDPARLRRFARASNSGTSTLLVPRSTTATDTRRRATSSQETEREAPGARLP